MVVHSGSWNQAVLGAAVLHLTSASGYSVRGKCEGGLGDGEVWALAIEILVHCHAFCYLWVFCHTLEMSISGGKSRLHFFLIAQPMHSFISPSHVHDLHPDC